MAVSFRVPLGTWVVDDVDKETAIFLPALQPFCRLKGTTFNRTPGSATVDKAGNLCYLPIRIETTISN